MVTAFLANCQVTAISFSNEVRSACQLLKLKNKIAALYLAKINFGVEPNHTRIVWLELV